MTSVTATRETFFIRNTQGNRWLVVAREGPILAHDGYADPELAAADVRSLALNTGRCNSAEIVRDDRGIPRMVDVVWHDPGVVV